MSPISFVDGQVPSGIPLILSLVLSRLWKRIGVGGDDVWVGVCACSVARFLGWFEGAVVVVALKSTVASKKVCRKVGTGGVLGEASLSRSVGAIRLLLALEFLCCCCNRFLVGPLWSHSISAPALMMWSMISSVEGVGRVGSVVGFLGTTLYAAPFVVRPRRNALMLKMAVCFLPSWRYHRLFCREATTQ